MERDKKGLHEGVSSSRGSSVWLGVHTHTCAGEFGDVCMRAHYDPPAGGEK